MKIQKQLRIPALLLAVLSCALIGTACGRKGDPTLTTFEKPSPVRNLKAIHREDEIILSWSYPESERETIKGFYVEKAETDGTAEFKNIGFLNSDASQFVDKDFKTGKKYLYKMRVYSLRNVISNESRVVRVNPSVLPDPPAGLSYSVTSDSVDIRWDRVDTALYNIYRSYEKGKYPALPLNKTPLKETFFTDKLEPGKITYYTVRSLLDTEIKDEGYPSAELEVNPETFVISPPSNLKYAVSPEKVYLMWDENPETWVKGYKVYRKRASEKAFRNIGESGTPAFTDNEPLTSKTFYYVTAVGPRQESAPSEIIGINPVIER